MTKPEISVSMRAQHDLRRIRAHIAMDSPLNAEKFLLRLHLEIGKLADIGRSLALAPEADQFPFPLRQLVVRPYRVLFRVDGRRLVILHIRHGARLPTKPDRKGNPK